MTKAEQSTASIIASDQDNLSEQEVADYLASHTDFFKHYPDLLEMLHVPHEKGNAISLVERQINLLREKNQQVEDQLASLVSVARENNETQQQIHRMIVELLATDDIETAMTYLGKELNQGFAVEHVVIRLLADASHPLDNIDAAWLLTSHSARQTLDDFTPTNEPLCGRLKPSQLQRLFGEQASSIGSSVLIPLRKGVLHGLIALGAADEHRFNPGMDTLYLKRLGELVSAALSRFVS